MNSNNDKFNNNKLDKKIYSNPSLSTFSGCNDGNCKCKGENYTFNPLNTAYATVPYFPTDNKRNIIEGKMDNKRFWSNDITNQNNSDNNVKGYSIYHGWGMNPTHYSDGVYNRHIVPHISERSYQTKVLQDQDIQDLQDLEYNISQNYPFRPLYPLEHLAPMNGSNYRRSYDGNNQNINQDRIRRRSARPFCC